MSYDITYTSWDSMKRRVRKDPSYIRYGITMCPQWESFEVFLKDAGRRPSIDHSLDRIDTFRGYEPGNVRWILKNDQPRNSRINFHITAFGETKIFAVWLDDPRCVVSKTGLYRRLAAGWSPERAISEPPATKFRLNHAKFNQ